LKNILVTIDFDKKVELLLDMAFELAESFDAKIWLLHLFDADQDIRKDHKMLQGYVKELREKGINTEELLLRGPTIEMIIKESTMLNIDLIIAGHHKHSFIYNALVASPNSQIINKSKIPVLIVPLE